MGYVLPDINLLNESEQDVVQPWGADLEEVKKDLVERVSDAFQDYKIEAEFVGSKVSPLAIDILVKPAKNGFFRKLKQYQDDLESRLNSSMEFISNADGTVHLIIKFPVRPIIGLRELIDNDEFKDRNCEVTIAAGVDYIGRNNYIKLDSELNPHLLIGGNTGAGKTNFIDTIMLSIICKSSPEDVQVILIDPKRVDSKLYEDLPHLLFGLDYDEDDIFGALVWVDKEIERRNELMSKAKARKIDAYNEKAEKKDRIPHIVVIIDEYSQLMMDYREKTEKLIDSIARMGRSAGVHLIIATQLPTRRVISDSIKANLTARASLAISPTASKIIVENKVKQRLLGNGDMLYNPGRGRQMVHIQNPMVTEDEIKNIVQEIIDKNPDYTSK